MIGSLYLESMSIHQKEKPTKIKKTGKNNLVAPK
jgi:hypothetical protein